MLEVSIPLFLHYKSLIKLRLFCIVVEEQSYSDEAFLKCKEMLWSGISSWAFSNNVIAHYLFVGTPPLAKKKIDWTQDRLFVAVFSSPSLFFFDQLAHWRSQGSCSPSVTANILFANYFLERKKNVYLVPIWFQQIPWKAYLPWFS